MYEVPVGWRQRIVGDTSRYCLSTSISQLFAGSIDRLCMEPYGQRTEDGEDIKYYSPKLEDKT